MPQDHKKELIDNATKMYLGTNAVSRSTKQPIGFTDVTKYPYYDPLFFGGEHESTGRYRHIPGTPETLEVTNYKRNPEWPDVMGTVYHELFHNLFNKAGIPRPGESMYKAESPSSEIAGPMFSKFLISERAGDPVKELPAYMGAYVKNEIPGVDQKMRSDYLSELFKTLPTHVAEQFIRMMQNYQASQAPPFKTGKSK